MGMELVTGYKGVNHVTSEQAGAENAGIVGDGRYVFDVGEKFNIEIISNNLIRIKNGYGINQGRVFGITQPDYEELTIDNGLAGVGRNDLVVARYQKVVETGIESVSLVVIKGTSSATPVDPTYNTGNILNGAIIDDYPLYRIVISGLSISLVVQLFQVVKPVTEILSVIDMIATEYSADNTYVLGEYHHYNGVLYKCTTAITNPEPWNASKWTMARIGNELKTAKDNITMLNDNLTVTTFTPTFNYATPSTPLCFKQGKRVKLQLFFSNNVIASGSVVASVSSEYRPSADTGDLRCGIGFTTNSYTNPINVYSKIKSNGDIVLNTDGGTSVYSPDINIEYLIP